MNELVNKSGQLPPDQQAIRDKCFHPSGRFVEFPKEEIEQSVPERFEKIVARCPHRIAVKAKNKALTYEQLNKMANRVGHAILAQGGRRKEPIALLLETGAPIMGAILGVLKAGKIYVSLDPSYPGARITSILEDSQPHLIVSNNQNLSLLNELAQPGQHVLSIDDLDSSLSDANLGLSLSPDAPTCIFYTSGSTGEPKGVLQNHRNMLHDIMNLTNNFRISTEDRLSLLYSFSFSASSKNMLAALLNGAGLFRFDFLNEGMDHLGAWLIREKITMCWFVSTVYRHFVSTLNGEEKFPDLRLINVGSESVSEQDVEAYKKHFCSNSILAVWLAATETGTIRQYFIDKETRLNGGIVPVGYAVEDKEILLLDQAGKEVGFNQVGEIAVKSRFLSPGYWRSPDLTQSKFLPDPNSRDKRIYLTGDLGLMLPDGCLVHHGRKDFQVKIRGHRVEVAEIDTRLLEHPAIKEAVVIGTEMASGNTRLIAYLVAAREPGPSINEIRGFLKETLPDHFVPSKFVFLAALPLTLNGKMDFRSLPDPGNSRPVLETAFVPPRTPVEKELAQIWAEVLSIDKIGIHDNFFDLGGHSLTATRVVTRVIRYFQLEIPLRCLFESPTVSQMAAVITEHQGKQLGNEELENILAELEALPDEEVQRLVSQSCRGDSKS